MTLKCSTANQIGGSEAERGPTLRHRVTRDCDIHQQNQADLRHSENQNPNPKKENNKKNNNEY